MSNAISLEFVSRDCKNGAHHSCHTKWEGMGFEIICNCKCGHNKKQNSGSMVRSPDQSNCKSQKDTGVASG